MIKEGAKLVAEYTDILEELNLTEFSPRSEETPSQQGTLEISAEKELKEKEEDDLEGLDAAESALVASLSGEPVHVDELCRLSGMPIATITSMLTLLELKGKVTQVGSMHYVRASAVEVTHAS
jgi:predicted Rossmann fold nucleotide-binding protein DprA/Smf involved in DNA uptake